MVRAKVVLQDYTVRNMLLHLFPIEGKKTALAKSQQIKSIIESVSDGNNDIVQVFKDFTQAGYPSFQP